MGRIVALYNQKGGVGKTTTAVNLSCALREAGKRVLLCDVDPQGHSTASMGLDKNTVAPSSYDVLIGGLAAEKAVVATKYCDVLPANRVLSAARIEIVEKPERETLLRAALAPLRARYDYIFIDCPPAVETLTINALCAADGVLAPVQCEYLALEGLSDLVATVRLMRQRLNPSLDIDGVLLTMYDGRTNLSMQVAAGVKKYFGSKVFKTLIPRNVRLSEAPSFGKPVLAYDRASRGAQAYGELAAEYIKLYG